MARTRSQGDQESAAEGYGEDETPYEKSSRESPPQKQDIPDVFLDVPKLAVDEIDLEVENLRAKITLQAEVLDLLKLNVGADVYLGKVNLTIKGVEAVAQLEVRLDNVDHIVERVLTTIDRNPEILEHITRGVGTALEEVGGGAGDAVKDVGNEASDAAKDVGNEASDTVKDVGNEASDTAKDVGSGASDAAKDVGSGASDAAKDVGSGTNGAGEPSDGGISFNIVGEVGKLAAKVTDTAEEAARSVGRRAGKVTESAGKAAKSVGLRAKNAAKAASRDPDE